MAHRGGRVIGAGALRISVLFRVSRDGQEREQGSEDNPNVHAHQGKPCDAWEVLALRPAALLTRACRPAIAYSRVDTGRNPSAVPSSNNFPASHLVGRLALNVRDILVAEPHRVWFASRTLLRRPLLRVLPAVWRAQPDGAPRGLARRPARRTQDGRFPFWSPLHRRRRV